MSKRLLELDLIICINEGVPGKKALCEFCYIGRLSFQIDLHLLVKQNENLTLHQKLLRALFCAPLDLCWIISMYPRNYIFSTGVHCSRQTYSEAASVEGVQS